MAESEKQSMSNLAEVVANLPDAKKQYFLGYAEGVVAGVAAKSEEEEEKEERP